MGNANEHLRQLANLGRAARAAGERLGLRMPAFGVSPELDDDDSASHVHLVYVTTPEDVAAKAEQIKAAAALNDTLTTKEPERPTLSPERRAALEELERSLRDGRGIL